MGNKILTILTVGEPLPVDSDHAKIRSMGYLANCFSNLYGEVNWVAPSFDHILKRHRKNIGLNIISKNQKLYILKSKSYKKNLSIKRIIFFFNCGRIFLKYLKHSETNILVAPLEFLPYCRKIVKYCEKKKICLIPDLLDMWDMSYNVVSGINKIFLLPYKLFMEFGHKFVLKHTKGFVSLSEPMREWCGKYLNRPLDSNTDKVFPLGFQRIYLEKEIVNKHLNKNIVFAGGLNKFVDFVDIYNAAKMTKDWNFIICGGGTYLEKYKADYKLDNIIFCGQVPFEKVCDYYSNSSLALLPYDSKSFSYHAPNKFAEYLSFGLPILLKPEGYMKNLISEYNCGFSYTSGEDIFHFLKKIKNSDIEKMRKNCHQLFLELFDGNKIYNDFSLYLLEMAKKYE